MKRVFSSRELQSVDTVRTRKNIATRSPKLKLLQLSEMVGLEHENPHQADSDALATAELLLMLMEKAQHLPLVTLEKLAELAYHLKSDIDMLFLSILQDKRKKLENLPDDLEVYRGIALKKKVLRKNKCMMFKSSIQLVRKKRSNYWRLM